MKKSRVVVLIAGVGASAATAIGLNHFGWSVTIPIAALINIVMMFLLSITYSELESLFSRLKIFTNQRRKTIHIIHTHDGSKSVVIRTTHAGKKVRVKHPPGFRLLHFVEFFYSRKFIEEVFKPLLADWQIEYYECLKENCLWQARWTSFRWTIRFMFAMGLTQAVAFLRDFVPFGRAKN